MSNIIKLKRGKGRPESDQLEKFTLGFDTENDIIYFNNGEKIVPVSGGYGLKYADSLGQVNIRGIAYIVPSIGDTQEQTYNVASIAPSDTSKLWIDTSSNYPLLKFYDTSSGTWKNIASIWA